MMRKRSYGAAGLNYPPRQSLFTHVNELALVVGLPPALVERALPFVTVFNGSSGVDAAIAAPEVIAALPDKTGTNEFRMSGLQLSNDTPANGRCDPPPPSGDRAKSPCYRIEAIDQLRATAAAPRRKSLSRSATRQSHTACCPGRMMSSLAAALTETQRAGL